MVPANLDIARSSLLFANCPENLTGQILERAVQKSFSRGATLFQQGDTAHSIYVVLDGWVKLFRVSKTGSEAVVGVFTRGHSFGEAVALRDVAYPVGAEAATDCTVLQIPAAVLRQMMVRHPEVSLAILASTFSHLHSLVAELEQLKAHKGVERVAQFLASLDPDATGQCDVTLPYDKVLIAGRLGMTPESLSRAFAQLKTKGVVIRQSHAEIASMSALRRFAKEDDGA